MSAGFFRGHGALKFVPTIVSIAAPTATAVNGGTDISLAVADVTGFETQLNRVSTPVLGEEVEVQSDGPQTFVDSSVTIIDDDGTGSDARSVAYQAAATALVEGATGYFVFSRFKKGTLAAGDPVTIYPGRIAAVNKSWTLDAQLARSVVPVVLTGTPAKDVDLV